MPDQTNPTERRAPTRSDEAVVAESVVDWKGHEVIDLDGEKIGKLEEVFYDVESDEPVFVVVRAGGLLGKRLSMVWIAGATVTPSTLRVNYRKSEVKDAPTYDRDLELTVDQEAAAYQYYGATYQSTAQSARRLARR